MAVLFSNNPYTDPGDLPIQWKPGTLGVTYIPTNSIIGQGLISAPTGFTGNYVGGGSPTGQTINNLGSYQNQPVDNIWSFTPNINKPQVIPVTPIFGTGAVSAFGKKLQATKQPLLKPLFSNPVRFAPMPNYTANVGKGFTQNNVKTKAFNWQ